MISEFTKIEVQLRKPSVEAKGLTNAREIICKSSLMIFTLKSYRKFAEGGVVSEHVTNVHTAIMPLRSSEIKGEVLQDIVATIASRKWLKQHLQSFVIQCTVRRRKKVNAFEGSIMMQGGSQ
ncbi:hypothetical protein M758_11G043400 [Ceratodon purpureus]|nr:hypothetical protein M758_11G043400 [Ceratodon purpureus]